MSEVPDPVQAGRRTSLTGPRQVRRGAVPWPDLSRGDRLRQGRAGRLGRSGTTRGHRLRAQPRDPARRHVLALIAAVGAPRVLWGPVSAAALPRAVEEEGRILKVRTTPRDDVAGCRACGLVRVGLPVESVEAALLEPVDGPQPHLGQERWTPGETGGKRSRSKYRRPERPSTVDRRPRPAGLPGPGAARRADRQSTRRQRQAARTRWTGPLAPVPRSPCSPAAPRSVCPVRDRRPRRILRTLRLRAKGAQSGRLPQPSRRCRLRRRRDRPGQSPPYGRPPSMELWREPFASSCA